MTSFRGSYFLHNIRYTPLDSVNLIFEGFADSQDVINAMINAGIGWTTRSIQTHQYLQNLMSPPQLKKEDGFVVKASRIQGIGLHHLWRFHMRVWQHRNHVVGAAHRESPGFLTHSVVSFDEGRQEVANNFSSMGYAITHQLFNTGTRIVDPPCDGYVTLIRR